MGMKLTDRLKVEHGIFLKQLAFLESLVKLGADPSVLAVVAETIVTAEEDHSQLEGRVLYPELEKAVGNDYGPLKQVAQEHADLAALVARLRGGTVDAALAMELVNQLRDHLEREIHGLFALAEERIPAERLEALVNWEEEHLYASMGRRKEWVERWLKDGAR
jgi:hemerythrin-like domain-containing protein